MAKGQKYKVVKVFAFRGRTTRKGQILRLRPETATKYLKSGDLIPANFSNGVDIIRAGLQLPEEVVLLGSGPRGKKTIGKIGNRFVIALNMAIEYPIR